MCCVRTLWLKWYFASSLFCSLSSEGGSPPSDPINDSRFLTPWSGFSNSTKIHFIIRSLASNVSSVSWRNCNNYCRNAAIKSEQSLNLHEHMLVSQLDFTYFSEREIFFFNRVQALNVFHVWAINILCLGSNNQNDFGLPFFLGLTWALFMAFHRRHQPVTIEL